MSKSGLGRGLGALLGGAPAASTAAPAGAPASAPAAADDRIQTVDLARIQPSSLQPRKEFAAEALAELADSIRQQGVLQPLVVRPRGPAFELIAGERRWRAAQMAGLREVPVVVRAVEDRTALELALVENLQRENLNPIEEAQGYLQLAEQFELTQDQIAAKVGKNRATVANSMRLLKLAPECVAHVREGRLSAGHAKALLALSDRSAQLKAAGLALKRELNVRQVETLVAEMLAARERAAAGGAAPAAGATPDIHVQALQDRLQERFSTKVRLNYRAGKGSIDIRFYSDDDLARVLEILGVQSD